MIAIEGFKNTGRRSRGQSRCVMKALRSTIHYIISQTHRATRREHIEISSESISDKKEKQISAPMTRPGMFEYNTVRTAKEVYFTLMTQSQLSGPE